MADLLLQNLPPWEEIGYFQSPVGNAQTLAASGTTQLVFANQNTVSITLSSTGTCQFTINLNNSAAGSIYLGPNGGAVTLNFRDHANLVTSDWFVRNIGAGSVQVASIQIILRTWPGQQSADVPTPAAPPFVIESQTTYVLDPAQRVWGPAANPLPGQPRIAAPF